MSQSEVRVRFRSTARVGLIVNPRSIQTVFLSSIIPGVSHYAETLIVFPRYGYWFLTLDDVVFVRILRWRRGESTGLSIPSPNRCAKKTQTQAPSTPAISVHLHLLRQSDSAEDEKYARLTAFPCTTPLHSLPSNMVVAMDLVRHISEIPLLASFGSHAF